MFGNSKEKVGIIPRCVCTQKVDVKDALKIGLSDKQVEKLLKLVEIENENLKKQKEKANNDGKCIVM